MPAAAEDRDGDAFGCGADKNRQWPDDRQRRARSHCCVLLCEWHGGLDCRSDPPFPRCGSGNRACVRRISLLNPRRIENDSPGTPLETPENPRGKSFQSASGSAAKFYGHTLDFRCRTEEMADRFDSQVRRAIRKAERRQCERARRWRSSGHWRFLSAPHPNASPSRSSAASRHRFFLNIYEHIIKPGLGFIVLARYGSRPIAAAVFFRFGKNAIYKYGASDKRFQEFRANNLVIWQAFSF